MWSYGQCADNIKSIVVQLNTMYATMIEFLMNDEIYQNILGALPNLLSAIKSTSLILCTMFFLIDFFAKTLHLQWVTWENVLMLMLKLIFAKVCIDNVEFITDAIYNGFNSFVHAVDGTTLKYDFIPVKDGWDSVYEYFVTKSEAYLIKNDISNGGWFDSGFLNFQPMLLNLQITIQGLIMKLIMIVSMVIVIARLFEIAVYSLVAPIPMATFACDGLSDVGKNFLKAFAAVIIQSLVLVVIFLAYSAVNNAIMSMSFPAENYNGIIINFTLDGIMGFVTTFTLGLGVMQSGTWAKKICGAM